MEIAEQLFAGYTAYTSAEEFGATATSEAPGTSPAFLTASSPECIQFSAAASAASIGFTVGWGC